jgi:hypothetical protein
VSEMRILVVLVYDGEIGAEELRIPVEYSVLKGMVILELLVKRGEVTAECLVGWECRVRYWVTVVSTVMNIVVVTGTVLVIGTAQGLELIAEPIHEFDWPSHLLLHE